MNMTSFFYANIGQWGVGMDLCLMHGLMVDGSWPCSRQLTPAQCQAGGYCKLVDPQIHGMCKRALKMCKHVCERVCVHVLWVCGWMYVQVSVRVCLDTHTCARACKRERETVNKCVWLCNHEWRERSCKERMIIFLWVFVISSCQNHDTGTLKIHRLFMNGRWKFAGLSYPGSWCVQVYTVCKTKMDKFCGLLFRHSNKITPFAFFILLFY